MIEGAKTVDAVDRAATVIGDEVILGWRKLHNEELHNLYFSPSIIRMIKSRRIIWAGHVARMGENRNVYRILVGKPEGKRSVGILTLMWEDNIKINLREIGWVVWTGLNLLRIGTSGGLL
jgi:hypothetical protein